MIGLGTIINVAAILVGGVVGLLGGKRLSERCQEALIRSMGVCVILVGIAGVMEKMLRVQGKGLTSGGTMILVISMALGCLGVRAHRLQGPQAGDLTQASQKHW